MNFDHVTIFHAEILWRLTQINASAVEAEEEVVPAALLSASVQTYDCSARSQPTFN